MNSFTKNINQTVDFIIELCKVVNTYPCSQRAGGRCLPRAVLIYEVELIRKAMLVMSAVQDPLNDALADFFLRTKHDETR